MTLVARNASEIEAAAARSTGADYAVLDVPEPLGRGQSDVHNQIAGDTSRIGLALGDGELHRRVSSTAARRGTSHVLTGEKHFVPDGAYAKWFLMPARTGGAVDDLAGIGLFPVGSGTLGLSILRFPNHGEQTNIQVRRYGGRNVL